MNKSISAMKFHACYGVDLGFWLFWCIVIKPLWECMEIMGFFVLLVF